MAKQNLLDRTNNKIIDTGKSVVKKLNKRIATTQSRKKKRKEIMGDDMYRQNMRETKNKAKALISKDTVTKVKGREAVKRVGEYKKAKAAKKVAKAAKTGAFMGAAMKAKQHKTDF